MSPPVAPPALTTRSRVDGFEVFCLRNESLEIKVIPELGAKVISLRNLRSGREWLWHPGTDLKLFRNKLADDFARSTMIGWDECLPSIAACDWRGRAIPDHGEVWSRPWELDTAACDRGVLQTSIRLAVSPFHFTRRIELRGNTFHLSYALANLDPQPQEFLWAMHPLLRIHPGDQLELTPETRQQLASENWLDTLDLASRTPACAKVFAGPLREGRAAVFNPGSGDRLTYEWDTTICNTLGLWLTRGGWNGYHHLALEPCNGAPDSLAVAAAGKHCGIIPGSSQQQWTVKMRVE
jgi:galactose mutarotase-like enzyme